MIDKLYSNMMNLLAAGWALVTSDTGDFQTVQVKFNAIETKDNIARVADYGFQSHPPDDHVAVVLSFSGSKTQGVVIATHHAKSRKRGLKKGEVCLSDDQGQSVYLTRAGITLTDKSGAIVQLNGDGTGTIDCPDGFTINGVEFKDGDVIIGGKSVKSHHHKDSRDGDTSQML